MSLPHSYFAITAEPMKDLNGVVRGISAKMTADIDAIVRSTIEGIRGKAKAVQVKPPNGMYASYTCSVCGDQTHTTSFRVPTFCQHCGRLFDYANKGGGDAAKR